MATNTRTQAATRSTREVAEGWFDALTSGDVERALSYMAPDVEFVNYTPIPGYNTAMPWIGRYRGPDAVLRSFKVFVGVCDVLDERLTALAVDGETALGVLHEVSRVKATGMDFEIEFIQRLTVREGLITHWMSYTDPSPILRALNGGTGGSMASSELIDAVRHHDAGSVLTLLEAGADANVRERASGLTALMIAAGQADQKTLGVLLDHGADPLTADSEAGATALHKACQGGSLEVVRLLVEAGAFVDAVAPTTGHTPLMDALWFKFPDLARYLLEQGAGLNLSTHYGFTLKEHFAYELNVNTIGKDLLLEAEKHLNERIADDERRVNGHRLMAAVVAGDISAVRALIAEGVAVDERFPIVNGFNDAHTALLVAARDGHTEIAAELLRAGADVNATEPTFGAVPLHKAVYNGHLELTRMIAGWPGTDLNYQGPTNGYTPLHDALWHGYEGCAGVLVEAGARLDLLGHDGKAPADLAREVFGDAHELTRAIDRRQAR